MEDQNLKTDLLQFTGTENYYPYHNLLLTDGVYHLANAGSCFWLMDAIFSHLATNALLAKQEFITLHLKVQNSKAKLTFEDGNDGVLASQKIDYTDSPLEKIKLFIVKEAFQFMVMLPGEY